MNIKPTSRNLKILAKAIKQVLINRDETTYMQELLGYKSNPLKNECYVASKLLYDMMRGNGISLYKKKDAYDKWHYWLKTDEGETIDITAEQYVIDGVEVPSSSYKDALEAETLWYPSYKDRIKQLHSELIEYINVNNLELD